MPPTEILTPPFDPARSPGRVLCFAPHPDDEVLGAGGTLYLHGRRKPTAVVRIVLATDGIAGDPEGRFDPTSYAERRRGESRCAAERLGLEPPVFWGLPDSCEVVESDKLRVIEMVAAQLREFAPDLVYLPWAGDRHSDHLVLHEAVVRGLDQVGFRGDALGYEVWSPISHPDVVVDITEVVSPKREALACFETQYAYGDLGHQVFGMNAYRSLLLERPGGFGEAFQRVVSAGRWNEPSMP